MLQTKRPGSSSSGNYFHIYSASPEFHKVGKIGPLWDSKKGIYVNERSNILVDVRFKNLPPDIPSLANGISYPITMKLVDSNFEPALEHMRSKLKIFNQDDLKNIKTKSTSNECLEIEYRNNSKVFVPIDSMHLVSKYFGPEEINIDELGSKKWERKKTLAIKKTFDTAAELLKTQAKRNLRKGKKYQIPKNEYFEFCREFQFIETQDQKNTILEIEKDLQDSIPMDR